MRRMYSKKQLIKLIEEHGGGGEGTVQSVNGITPDETGDVELDARDIYLSTTETTVQGNIIRLDERIDDLPTTLPGDGLVEDDGKLAVTTGYGLSSSGGKVEINLGDFLEFQNDGSDVGVVIDYALDAPGGLRSDVQGRLEVNPNVYQKKLTAGANISIVGNVISASGGGGGSITPTDLLTKMEGSDYISVDLNEAETKVLVELDETMLETVAPQEDSIALITSGAVHNALEYKADTTDVDALDTRLTTAEGNINNKQAKLVSGTNIKTINGNSILGAGNLAITGSNYTAGDGIGISGNEIKVKVDDTTISVDNGGYLRLSGIGDGSIIVDDTEGISVNTNMIQEKRYIHNIWAKNADSCTVTFNFTSNSAIPYATKTAIANAMYNKGIRGTDDKVMTTASGVWCNAELEEPTPEIVIGIAAPTSSTLKVYTLDYNDGLYPHARDFNISTFQDKITQF